MGHVQRSSAEETRRKMQSGGALLVCAYDDEEKCKKMRLEGAITLGNFRSQLNSLPKDRDVIFYCA